MNLQNSSEIKWVYSPSSPILMLPRALSRQWKGASDPGYRRASEGHEPIFPISVGRGQGLVLEDGFHTAWWPLPELLGSRGRHTGGLIVRWLWAKSSETVVEALRSIPLDSYEPESFTLNVLDGATMLFEAKQDASRLVDEIPMFLVGGEYAILSANVQPDDDTCLLVHRIQLIQ